MSIEQEEDDYPYDDDDPPWASPEIQLDYEAALGRFILEFNRIDNLLTSLIDTVLERSKRSDLSKQCRRDFGQKLFAVELLQLSTEGEVLLRVPVQKLREIAKNRNTWRMATSIRIHMTVLMKL